MRTYLKKRGHKWYVVVYIPRRLRAAAGKNEFIKALGTGDLKEANRLKHPWVAEFKQRIAKLEHSGSDPDQAVFDHAFRLRDAMTRADHPEVIRDVVDDRAQELAEEDPELAERFHKAALGEATFIKDHWPRWLSEIECTPKTKAQHEQAIRKFLEWSGEVDPIGGTKGTGLLVGFSAVPIS